MGDHMNAALMLLRVAANIKQFPAHIVPILTSVVIECQRAKLHSDAYKYACEMMRPEHRPQIPDAHKKKIENIVRKPATDEDAIETTAPCMYCEFNMVESQLDCPNCKNISPFCVVTGKRMLKTDWSYCPGRKFPG